MHNQTMHPSPSPDPESVRKWTQTLYPLFETMLLSRGLQLQPTYTCKDVDVLFGVTARTIQSKVSDGILPSRKLIGGGRFLPADLEEYLRNAEKPSCR